LDVDEYCVPKVYPQVAHFGHESPNTSSLQHSVSNIFPSVIILRNYEASPLVDILCIIFDVGWQRTSKQVINLKDKANGYEVFGDVTQCFLLRHGRHHCDQGHDWTKNLERTYDYVDQPSLAVVLGSFQPLQERHHFDCCLELLVTILSQQQRTDQTETRLRHVEGLEVSEVQEFVDEEKGYKSLNAERCDAHLDAVV